VKDRVIAEQDDLIAELRAALAEALRRLALDSSNSSKPPSSDGLKKKPRLARSLRGRSGKTSGGQEGHKGDTLRQVGKPDIVVPHTACVCEHCRSPLGPNSTISVEKRQVFDLPERPLPVSEHRASEHRCEQCRGVTKAAFPAGGVSPAQYGERLEAAAVYLNVQQLIPEDRTAQALGDLFGAPSVCPASVVGWVGKKDEELRAHRRTRRRGEGSPSRRNRLSRRRQAAMAAHDVEPDPHLLSRRGNARRGPRGIARGRRRARPLSPLIAAAGWTRSPTPSATPISCANSRA
jgi:hypothetical protein